MEMKVVYGETTVDAPILPAPAAAIKPKLPAAPLLPHAPP
jgi:hypothetical protein